MATFVRRHAQRRRGGAVVIRRGEHQALVLRVVMVAKRLLVLADRDIADAGRAQNLPRRFRPGEAGLDGRAAVPGVSTFVVRLRQEANRQSEEEEEEYHVAGWR